MRVTILYDNGLADARLTPGWGFSCLIELAGRCLLFDTGGDGTILLRNMDILAIPPSDIGTVVLSHAHMDHVGGLGSFLRRNCEVTVYLPRSVPGGLKWEVQSSGAAVVEIHRAEELLPGVFTTGEMGDVPEQGLIVGTPSGSVVVTGCAHPGIIPVVEAAQRVIRGGTSLVVGGFHFPRPEAATRLKEMGVEKVAPCHCTGEEARRAFRLAYGAGYIEVGTGTRIEIE